VINKLYQAYDLLDEEGSHRKSEKGIGLKAMGVHCEVITKADDLPENTIRMVASTEDQDRMGDIIRAEGWSLAHYLKTPVVLWGHNHGIPAPTKAARTWVEEIKLLQDWYFDPAYRKANPLSNLLWHGYQPGGPFEASSVGFAPITWQDEFEDDEREELGLGSDGCLFITQELYEVSAVNVPANPYALQQLRAKGLDTRPLEELMSIGTVIEVQDEDTTKCKACDDIGTIEEAEIDTRTLYTLPCRECEKGKGITETMRLASIEHMKEELINEGYQVVEAPEKNVIKETFVISEDELTDHAITVLTNEGYQVIAPGDGDCGHCGGHGQLLSLCQHCEGSTEEPDILTLTEPEVVLEIEPEPEIDAEEVKEALAEAYQKRARIKVKQIIKGQINHLLGIVEEHND